MGLRCLSLFVLLMMAAWAAAGSPSAADEASSPAGAKKVVNLELKDTPIRDAIDSIFRDSGLKYYVRPEVSGRVVEMKLSGLTVEEAIRALADAADLSLTIENGVYVISPANKVTVSKSRRRASTQPAEASAQPAAATAQPATGTSAQTPAPQESPPAAEATGGEQGASPSGVTTLEPPPPVYYGWPGAGYYDSYAYGPYFGPPEYPPVYQLGGVQFLDGRPSIVIAGGNPPVLPRLPLVAPPPLYIGSDAVRFLPNPWPVRPRTYLVIPYYPRPY
ncbi:MAG: STN domain-containing protein [Armatimonadota bacterium]